MTNKKDLFWKRKLASSKHSYLDSRDLILVSYRVLWVDKVTQIEDSFLWPKSQREIKEMKMFAINFLSDYLGLKRIA
jgi:hypothetical protein